MSINAICAGCTANFLVDDSLAGRKGKCPKCEAIITVPAISNVGEETKKQAMRKSSSESPSGADEIFSHDRYGIKQKKIAISEKYYIKDSKDNDLFFSVRKARMLRGLFSVLVFFIILGLTVYASFYFFGIDNPIYFFGAVIMGIFAGTLLAIFVSPIKHIQFFKAHTNEPDTCFFEIKEDSKFQVINKTYTMINQEGKVLCKYRKNIFTDMFRKKWHMEFDQKHIIVKEDSILLGLLRRFAIIGKFIRTNFIFTDDSHPNSLGAFRRKFELFDNYTLDLTDDDKNTIPKQYAIGMAILLDTGEKR